MALHDWTWFDFGEVAGTPIVSVVSPPSTPCVNFGSVYLGISLPVSVVIGNAGNALLDMSSIVIDGDFAIIGNNCSSIEPGQSCTVMLTFTPTEVGDASGTMTITSNADDSPTVIQLCGAGVCADLGTVNIGLSGFASFPMLFEISSATPSNANVTVDGTDDTLDLLWEPTADGEDPGTVELVTDEGTFTLELCGEAEQIHGAFVVVIDPAQPVPGYPPVNCRNLFVCQPNVQDFSSVTFKNIGDVTATGVSYASGSASFFITSLVGNGNLAPGASCTVNFTWQGIVNDDTGNITHTSTATNSPVVECLLGQTGTTSVTATPNGTVPVTCCAATSFGGSIRVTQLGTGCETFQISSNSSVFAIQSALAFTLNGAGDFFDVLYSFAPSFGVCPGVNNGIIGIGGDRGTSLSVNVSGIGIAC